MAIESCGLTSRSIAAAYNAYLQDSLTGSHLAEEDASAFGFGVEEDYKIWFEPNRIVCASGDTSRLEALAIDEGNGLPPGTSFELTTKQKRGNAVFYDLIFDQRVSPTAQERGRRLAALIGHLRTLSDPIDIGPNRSLFPVPIHRLEAARDVDPSLPTPTEVEQFQSDLAEGEKLDLARRLGDWCFAVVDSGVAKQYHSQIFKSEVRAQFDDIDRVHPRGSLDRVPGHGTFVAGILARWAPGVPIEMERADAVSYLDGRPAVRILDERTVMRSVTQALDGVAGGPAIMTLSFGGYAAGPTEFVGLRNGLQGILEEHQELLIMAAAGNCNSTDRFYPAAFADHQAFEALVSVGAGTNNNPAEFSNRGAWVQEWAEGDGVVSTYPATLGAPTRLDDADNSYAKWSGTSFATPRAAARLARWASYNDETSGPRTAWAKRSSAQAS